MSDPGNQPTPTPTPTPAPAPALWSAAPEYAALDDETKGYFQNRGWDRKTNTEALLEAAKAHREAEKALKVPHAERARIPKDPADPEWKNLWTRLGASDNPKDYDFSSVKFGDGSDLDDSFVAFMQKNAAELNLPKDKASELTQRFVKYLDSIETTDGAENTAKLAAEHDKLNQNWGANKESFKFIAKQAAAKLGVPPEAVAALEKAAGYAVTMEMFLKIGQALGEDKYIASQTPGATGVMTREQAVATLAERKADKAWGLKVLKGDPAATKEWEAFTALATAVPRQAA